jgi:hypothetical protein
MARRAQRTLPPVSPLLGIAKFLSLIVGVSTADLVDRAESRKPYRLLPRTPEPNQSITRRTTDRSISKPSLRTRIGQRDPRWSLLETTTPEAPKATTPSSSLILKQWPSKQGHNRLLPSRLLWSRFALLGCSDCRFLRSIFFRTRPATSLSLCAPNDGEEDDQT